MLSARYFSFYKRTVLIQTEYFNVLSLFKFSKNCSYCAMAVDSHSVYQFVVKGVNNEDISLEKYKGKVLLIVNVASQCGLTNANYTQLKEILDKYKSQGLEVAAFPCNQFQGQEPGCEIDIQNFVRDSFKFEPDLYKKIDVNGSNEHPLYKFLKKEKGGTLFDAIKWNFTKFLVGRNGYVVARYGPTTEPKDIVGDIERELAKH